MDKIHFFCHQEGHLPHVYFVVCPQQSSEDPLFSTMSKEALIQQNKNLFARAMLTHLDKKLLKQAERQSDAQVEIKWGNMEKDTLKK